MTDNKPIVWLITGCSSGLGLSLARQVLRAGHKVIASSRNPSATPSLVAETKSSGGDWIKLDITSPSLQEAVDVALSVHGHIDVLVNNAGLAVLTTVEDCPLAMAEKQMATNFTGPMRLIQLLLPAMRSRKSGIILNISSAGTYSPHPAGGVYMASKAALEAMTDALALEVKPFGIKAMIVSLGTFPTELSSNGSKVDLSEPYRKDNPAAMAFDMIRKIKGLAVGDVDKAARRIFDAIMGDEEYYRLIVGSDTYQYAEKKVAILQKSLGGQKETARLSDREQAH